MKGIHNIAHRIGFILFFILVGSSNSLQAQGFEGYVSDLMKTYPKAHLLDIYKSCFQDYLGAEHLVTDSMGVRAYLVDELNSTDLNDFQSWYYEYCGPEGRHVRVSLRAVKEGLISEDVLLNAFIRSANGFKRPTVKRWKKVWKRYIKKINKMGLALPDYEKEKTFIDDILSQGQYAISHSEDYRNAYHPHYRIVERTIFASELKPILDR